MFRPARGSTLFMLFTINYDLNLLRCSNSLILKFKYYEHKKSEEKKYYKKYSFRSDLKICIGLISLSYIYQNDSFGEWVKNQNFPLFLRTGG